MREVRGMKKKERTEGEMDEEGTGEARTWRKKEGDGGRGKEMEEGGIEKDRGGRGK